MSAQKFFGRLILGGMIFGYSVARFFGPKILFGFLDSLPPVCPMRILFKLKCSFCGMTHAFLHLFFGEFREAIQENALSVPLFFGLLTGAGLAAIGRFPNGNERLRRRLALFSIGILILYTTARNFP